jgi:predicted aspartyl protease
LSADDFCCVDYDEVDKTSNKPEVQKRQIDNSIVVPQFDGSGDLELFLKRFMLVSRYYRWSEEEKLFRLEHCLAYNAQYVLMDAPPASSVDEFVGILRSRFGFVANAEQYRAELSRLRRGTLSMHDLYLAVRRLVNKAFPGQWSTSTEIYARDAFLNALDDRELRGRILMTVPPPETLSAVYDIAERAITVVEAVGDHRPGSTLQRLPSCFRQYHARTMMEEAPASSVEKCRRADVMELQKQVAELQAELSKVAISRSTAAPAEKVTRSEESSSRDNRSRMPSSRIVCWNCNEPDHISRNCKVKKSKNLMKSTVDVAPKANILCAHMRTKIKVYMIITYHGRNYRALLDTGCDVLVVGSRVLPNLSYQHGTQKMFAANMSPVPILGSAVVSFAVAGVQMQHEFMVSDAVEEIIFGSDWLVMNRCQWDFDTGSLLIQSIEKPGQVQLINGGQRGCVRRIYARDTVELKPYSQSDIAVNSIWSTIPPSHVNWLVEWKELHRGLLMARTLLSSDSHDAFVRVVNCGPTPCTVTAGELLTSAEIVDCDQCVAKNTSSNNYYEHVRCLIDALPSELTDTQRQ